MSGSMPFAWIERPDGVNYRAVVNRKAPLSAPMGMMDLHGTYVRIIALQLCLPASAAIVGGTASLLASARFPQKKVLEDELAIAGRKRRTASLAI
jgi:hypothetical protein